MLGWRVAVLTWLQSYRLICRLAVCKAGLQSILCNDLNERIGIADNAKRDRQPVMGILREGGIERRFFDVKAVMLGLRGCGFRAPFTGIYHIIVPAPIFQGFSRVSKPEQIGLRGEIAAAGAPQVFQMLAQFTGRAVFAAAFKQPGYIHGDVSGKSLLFLGGGQPADQEQIFGVGGANDAVLAGQPQCCQGTERQMAEVGGGIIRSNGLDFV